MTGSVAPLRAVTAVAPGKVILFGEHAINRGQPALATAVGIFARCQALRTDEPGYRLRSGAHYELVGGDTLATLQQAIGTHLETGNYDAIRELARRDYFAPAKYILAAFAETGLPVGVEITWTSDLPASSGLGSGGAAFTALVAAISALLPEPPSIAQRAMCAHRGDIIAHGGVASALDTQTSLLGGVIQMMASDAGRGLAAPVDYAPGLTLVVGNTGVGAATGEINGRVRRWLAEHPRRRMAYFVAIGALSRAATPLLAQGEWAELGHLLTLNQLILEKIGVSSPQLDALIDAALDAGAWGAKLSGSGGGGIMLALVSPEAQRDVAQAIVAAGGTALTPAVGVPGVSVTLE